MDDIVVLFKEEVLIPLGFGLPPLENFGPALSIELIQLFGRF